MEHFQDDWNNDAYELEYERIQDEKKRRLEKRKRRNFLRLVGICALGVFVLFACFSVLMSLNKGFMQKPAGFVSSSGGGASSSALPQSVQASSLPGSQLPSQPAATIAQDPAAWNLWLVSAAYPLASNFAKPETRNVIQDNTVYLFDTRMADALEQMRSDCNAASGGGLVITSGYMGYGYLDKLYNYYLEQYTIQGLGAEKAREAAAKMADPPGTSDNHTGLAVHFAAAGAPAMDPAFAATGQYTWLVENAANYGFVLRYPQGKEGATGLAHRPWHFRFVGVAEAAQMNEAGICLEEYVGKA